ncbi:hypothetical protein RGU72_06250 [Undibacterium sp. 5I1]|nr:MULTISPECIES: hypothetical protein [unclassified Undibacterium]MDY7537856.1 hypothetical protein [Undibacterium sp. 5I1]MEB0232312.1 hypothetical protein [Undibacterium sp. 10I3]MEB0259119.1 hypothetical protein [Undibacterium sp. 5I1]
MWSRDQAFAQAPYIETWPDFNRLLLCDSERDEFERRVKAIKLYAHGENLREIQLKTGVDPTDLPRLAARCLMLASDGKIFGFRGLRKFSRLVPYEKRSLAGPKRREQRGGQSGSLGYLKKLFPDIEFELIAQIRQEAKYIGVPEYRIRANALHRIFIRLVRAKIANNEYPPSGWPFNTKLLGLRSIQKYMTEIVLNNFSRSVQKSGEREARAHLSVGNGKSPLLCIDEPFDAVEIDAYNIDAHCVLKFATPEGTETDLLVERLWLIAAIDRASTAVLAWRIVYRSEVASDDVLHVIRDAVGRRWEPRRLSIPGLNYPEGGGLPSGILDEAYQAVWTTTLLDGALAHLAIKVRERARRVLGFVVNWGPVGHFERRPNVERTFKEIAQGLMQRLPSTTGSNPQNGRARDAVGAALKLGIYAEHIEDLVEVFFSQHNIKPSEGISYLSPIGFLRHYLCGDSPICEARRLPVQDQKLANAFATIIGKTVRGDLINGRRPYIQIDRVHYTSPVLADNGLLIGMRLLVHIDEDDMRQVHVFLEDGSDLGILTALGRWGLTKHSRKTRLAINSLISERLLIISKLDDPVQVYLKYLGTPKKTNRKNQPQLTPRQATDASRIATEAGISPQIYNKPAELSPTTTLSQVSARTLLLKDTQNQRPRMAKNRR